MTSCKNSAIKIVFPILIAIAVLFGLTVFSTWNTGEAFAEGSVTGVVTFYSDSGEVFATVEAIDGAFTVPEGVPYSEGKEFIGWAVKGQIGYLTAGNTYSASGDLSVFAVWNAPTGIEDMPPAESDGWHPDPILLTLLILLGLVIIALLFVTVWCGVLKRSLKSLFCRRTKR